MNKFLLFVIGLMLILPAGSNAQAVVAYFDYAPFYSREAGTYVETYLSVKGKSVKYVINADSALEARVEVTMLFKNAGEVIEFRKFKVISPPILEPQNGFPDFIDLQRISIPDGVYNFELYITDMNAADSITDFKYTTLLTVDIQTNEMALSGIEWVDRYEVSQNSNIYMKDSMECIPFVSDIFAKDINYLRLYAELYNAAKEIGAIEDFLITFSIEETHTGKPIKEFSSFTTQRAINRNVIYKEINIKKLPTGNYYLTIQVHDKQGNSILTSKKYFKRIGANQMVQYVDYKKITVINTFAANIINPDTLLNYIKALKPICDVTEINFIDSSLHSANIKLMQQFFLNFWKNRNEKLPEFEWNTYYKNLKTVEQRFKTNDKAGYSTARGKVFLQLGEPASITNDKNATSAFQHEIWDYYRIADQTNVQFIFYNKTDLPNDFELLHSNFKGFNGTTDTIK